MPDFTIDANGLSKSYGTRVAVRDFSVQVRRGEAFGFLGPNGAGKSTSIKMLLGLVRPTGGRAALLGKPIGDRETRGRIGFLPEHFRFYDWLSAPELVTLHGKLNGMGEEPLRRRVPQLLERVGLSGNLKKPIREFSKGMMQRAGLAQALVNDPEVLFLDEPTSGLDPAGRKLVREITREQCERGATVFLNSHLLGEVEQSCDRVAFIKDGRVLKIYGMGAWQQERTAVEARITGLETAIFERIRGFAWQVAWDGDCLRFAVEEEDQIPEIIRWIVESGAQVHAVVPQRMSLEELYLREIGTEPGL